MDNSDSDVVAGGVLSGTCTATRKRRGSARSTMPSTAGVGAFVETHFETPATVATHLLVDWPSYVVHGRHTAGLQDSSTSRKGRLSCSQTVPFLQGSALGPDGLVLQRSVYTPISAGTATEAMATFRFHSPGVCHGPPTGGPWRAVGAAWRWPTLQLARDDSNKTPPQMSSRVAIPTAAC